MIIILNLVSIVMTENLTEGLQVEVAMFKGALESMMRR